ncbi:hypothetical protein BGZ51_002913 [Haplosporangium sp. Z 767]|nr:hypothetical protein BGZ51_002913 [Haplosporangium sp. Z 767]KAF9185947.1 hypothetical protein BGZ50_002792 [Haplosporangium sp. Z 11]
MAPRLLTISFSIFLISALVLKGAHLVHAIPTAVSVAASDDAASTSFMVEPKELNAASGAQIQPVSEKRLEQVAPQQQLAEVLEMEAQVGDQFAQASTKATRLDSSSLESQNQELQQKQKPQLIQQQQQIHEQHQIQQQQRMQQLQLQQQIQFQRYQQQLQLQQQKQLLQLQMQQQRKQYSMTQKRATTADSESHETDPTKPLSGVATSSAPGTAAAAGHAGGIVCYYDNVARGLLHCSDGMSYYYASQLKIQPHQPLEDIQLTKESQQHKKRVYVSTSPQMYSHGSQVLGMNPMASEAPVGSVSQPAVIAGTPPTDNIHPLNPMMEKRSSDTSESLPAFEIEAESWQSRPWNKYAAGCLDHEGWGKCGDMDEGWSKHNAGAGSGYDARYANWIYGTDGKKGYDAGDKDDKKDRHHEGMDKRDIPAAGSRAEFNIIPVPIDVNLLWDGKNVILLPGTTAGPGLVSGYRSRRFRDDSFGRPIGGIRGPVIPDENPDVIPVPIEIDMLVHPDGQMTLLPPDGATV